MKHFDISNEGDADPWVISNNIPVLVCKCAVYQESPFRMNASGFGLNVPDFGWYIPESGSKKPPNDSGQKIRTKGLPVAIN